MLGAPSRSATSAWDRPGRSSFWTTPRVNADDGASFAFARSPAPAGTTPTATTTSATTTVRNMWDLLTESVEPLRTPGDGAM